MKAQQQPQQLTCIPDKLFRCEPEEKKCMTIPIVRELDAVEIAVDFVEHTVVSYSGNKTISSSDIDSIESKNNLVYFSGKGKGIDKAFRSWTAIIDLEDGRLYTTTITTGAGHIIYGKCYDKSK